MLANLSQQRGFPAAGSSVFGSRSRISLAVSLAAAMFLATGAALLDVGTCECGGSI